MHLFLPEVKVVRHDVMTHAETYDFIVTIMMPYNL